MSKPGIRSAPVISVLLLVMLSIAAGCTTAAPAPAATPTAAPAAPAPKPTAPPPTSTPAPTPTQPPAAVKPISPPVTVRVGGVRALAEAGQAIALQKGYFKELGIEIEYTNFDSAAQMVPALAAGQLDIGTGAVSAGLFNAVLRGVPLKIVGPQARHDPGASAVQVVVRKDLIDSGQFKDYTDLKGRTIAIASKASTNEYAAIKALEKGKLNPADAKIMEMSFPDMATGFANKGIDVGIQAEPPSTLGVNNGVAVKWKEIADVLPGIQFTVVLFSGEFASQKAEAGRLWTLAYLKGLRDYNDAFFRNKGRQDVVSTLSQRTTVTNLALYDQMGFPALDPNGIINEQSVADQLKWFTDNQLINGTVDLKQVIDRQFVDYAISRLGKY